MKDSTSPSLVRLLLRTVGGRDAQPETTDVSQARDHGDTENIKGKSALMKYAMWACCAVMALPLAGYLLSGGTVSGLWQNVSVLAPLLLCVAVHLVLCKMIMGRSCHSASDGKCANAATNVEARSAPAAVATVQAPSTVRELVSRS